MNTHRIESLAKIAEVSLIVGTALLIWLLMAGVANATPPIGKTYFTILMGVEEPYGTLPGCVSFTETEICFFISAPPNTLDTCGDWMPGTETGKQTSFTFDFEFLEFEGESIRVDGQGRVDSRGRKSTVSSSGRARDAEGKLNFGMVGRATSPNRCRQLVDDYNDDDS